jgi:hypothetical protein
VKRESWFVSLCVSAVHFFAVLGGIPVLIFIGVNRRPSAAKKTMRKSKGFCFLYQAICVYLRLSRSNVHLPGVPRTVSPSDLREFIGTGFICG